MALENSVFTVRPYESRTLSWWSDERKNIELAPSYQRRGQIWSTSDKAFLIDSILNGYDIPKIYIADFTYYQSSLNTSKKAFSVIDGRQRFEAIFDFFDDKFPLSNDFVLIENKEIKIEKFFYSQLKSRHPELAKRFDNFNLGVMSVITNDEDRINELFVRLNRSVPLSGAEVRGAMGGNIPFLISYITDHPFFKKKISFNVNRKQDHNAAAKLLLIEYRGQLVDTKKGDLDRFVKEFSNKDIKSVELAAIRVYKILDSVCDFFLDKDYALKLATSLPVYYWYFREEKPGPEIAENIRYFESWRRENKHNASTGNSQAIDGELQTYDYFNRSPDDATSHERRYDIFVKKMVELSLNIKYLSSENF